jgi:hypothetical protein
MNTYKENYEDGYKNGHLDRFLGVELNLYSPSLHADNLPGYSIGYRHGIMGIEKEKCFAQDK